MPFILQNAKLMVTIVKRFSGRTENLIKFVTTKALSHEKKNRRKKNTTAQKALAQQAQRFSAPQKSKPDLVCAVAAAHGYFVAFRVGLHIVFQHETRYGR